MLFKALTEKGPDNQGLRRSARLADIAAIAGVENEEVIHVVEKFKKEGGSLLTSQGGEKLDGESIIEISHESLMRIWGKLKQWVEEEAESASQYKRLAEAAEADPQPDRRDAERDVGQLGAVLLDVVEQSHTDHGEARRGRGLDRLGHVR